MKLLMLKEMYKGDKLMFIMISMIILIVITGVVLAIIYKPYCNYENNNLNKANYSYNQYEPFYDSPYEVTQIIPPLLNNKYSNKIWLKIKSGIKFMFIILLVFGGAFLLGIIIECTSKAIYLRASLFKNFGIVKFKNITRINL